MDTLKLYCGFIFNIIYYFVFLFRRSIIENGSNMVNIKVIPNGLYFKINIPKRFSDLCLYRMTHRQLKNWRLSCREAAE